MDEPFGAVDPLTRERLQIEFARIQRELRKTVVFVTHDVDEAIRLADRIAIMRDGRLLQYDTPEDVLDHPADKFVHDFVGADRALKRLVRVRVTDVMTQPPRASRTRRARAARGTARGRSRTSIDARRAGSLGWVDRRARRAEACRRGGDDARGPPRPSVPDDATLKEALSAMLGLGFRRIAVVGRARPAARRGRVRRDRRACSPTATRAAGGDGGTRAREAAR